MGRDASTKADYPPDFNLRYVLHFPAAQVDGIVGELTRGVWKEWGWVLASPVAAVALMAALVAVRLMRR